MELNKKGLSAPIILARVRSKFSDFEHIQTSILNVYNEIRNPKQRTLEIINEIRINKDSDKKNLLDRVYFGGTFELKGRYNQFCDGGLVEASGFMVLDIDYIENIKRVENNLRANPFVFMFFIVISLSKRNCRTFFSASNVKLQNSFSLFVNSPET